MDVGFLGEGGGRGSNQPYLFQFAKKIYEFKNEGLQEQIQVHNFYLVASFTRRR